MLVKTIPLNKILPRPHKDLRAVDPEHVKRLAESIKEIGLQTPISLRVVPDEDGHDTGTYLLVAGLHRLYACSSLEWTEIPAVLLDIDDVDRELWEIDENLIRAELTELERSKHLAKRKQLYEAKRQWTKHGGNRTPCGQFGHTADDSFVANAAERTGMSARNVRRSVHRAEAIAPQVKEAIADMPEIANKGVELDALAAVEPEDQKAAVEAVKSGRARSVREAAKTMGMRPSRRQRRPPAGNRRTRKHPAAERFRGPSDEKLLVSRLLESLLQYQEKTGRHVAGIEIISNDGAISDLRIIHTPGPGV